MTRRARLDALVVDKGLADTRARAQSLILAGQVRVNDAVVSKAGTAVAADAAITLITPDHPYVGRGGVKLSEALDQFGIDPAGRTALDIGASTGGFTDALLQRDARRVAALDVGRGQLDWRLRSDPRVIVLDGINARHLTPAMLPPEARQADIITIDVAFISLRLILPAVPPLLAPDGDVVALVKPQFEATRAEVGKGGIVRDPGVQARVVDEVAMVADAVALARVASAPSPLRGAGGNREVFLHLRLRDTL